MEAFIISVMVLCLFGIGVAVGALIENKRLQTEGRFYQTQTEEPSSFGMSIIANELELQNKKLDTLLMRQVYVDPETTQDMPAVED